MSLFSRPYFLSLCLAALLAAAPLAAQEPPAKAPEPAPVATPETTPPAPSNTNPAEPAPEDSTSVPPFPGKPSPPDISMEAFGTANPDCLEWTNTCRICARDAQNDIGCSTPGIACLPGEISCKTKRK